MKSTSFYNSECKIVSALLDEHKHQSLCFLLKGPLGAGKTTFVKELLSLYGYDPQHVQSPTFLKVLEHKVKNLGLIIHCDFYRCEDALDLQKLALAQYEDARALFIEWPEIFWKELQKKSPWTQELFLKTVYEINFEEKPLKIKKLNH